MYNGDWLCLWEENAMLHFSSMSKCIPGRPNPLRNSCSKTKILGLDDSWHCFVLSSMVQKEPYIALTQHLVWKCTWISVLGKVPNVIPAQIVLLVCRVSCRCSAQAVLFNRFLSSVPVDSKGWKRSGVLGHRVWEEKEPLSHWWLLNDSRIEMPRKPNRALV